MSDAETYRGFLKHDLPKPHVKHRYIVWCPNCGKKWSPSIGAGYSRHAGSPRCPGCGTDYRAWVAFQRLFGADT